MLSNNLEHTLSKALSIATEKHHEYATYEHLLLALIDDSDVKQALIENNVAIELLIIRLQKYIEHNLVDLVDQNVKEAKPTAGFQRIIQRAALHGRANGQKNITGVHVLAEFFFEYEAYALLCLKESNLSRSNLLEYIKKYSQPIKKLSTDTDTSQVTLINNLKQTKNNLNTKLLIGGQEAQEQNELEKYCTNLNECANTDAIDSLVGRQQEIQRAIEILCRRKKNNAILVGEPGVGKTAIAEGMAIRIVKNDVPEMLKNAVIYSLDVGSLVAGTKFRGDFEERIKNLLKKFKNTQNAILFIDEIHTIIGAGSNQTGSLDASNLLKPALAKGELRCIGSTTFKEYGNHFEKDAALIRRFQKIVITEPNEKESFNILKGLKNYYEQHHNVVYLDSALKAAVNLSTRYINDRYLPDKAIDLIDEVGSRSKLLKNNKQKDEKIIITNKHIEELLSSILNIPQISIESSEISHLKSLSHNLQKCIFGQNEAINSLCASIKLSRAGLRRTNRPTGCYLFAGPTGVGKTELAKQLAIFSNMKLLKFDMSEFAEQSAPSKLLGSAPGYVGFDQGGMLTSEVDKYPYSVVLLDEIEKANSEVLNLLLQVMDEGVLKSSCGKMIDFTHTIIILTTNVIAKEQFDFGFNKNDQNHQPNINMDGINSTFSPEFQSRLDNIIFFNPIDGIVDKIVSKNLQDLKKQLADKKVSLKISPAVKRYFAQKCFNADNGARGLDRTIDSKIKQIIADEILFGKLVNGGIANVSFCKKNHEIVFKFSNTKDIPKKQPETTMD